VYVHYALDRWFETEVKPRLRGQARLIRYCDDFIIGFAQQDDAQRVQAVLGKRIERFGLTLHPEKTRLLPCGRPSHRQQSGKGPATFDFLGFVRHEVAYTAVMTQKGGHNLVCCHQYPTQTCGWSNLAV
jgi:hypothetical protein